MSVIANQPSDAEVYAIPVVGRWLLFSPQTWTAAVVNRSAVTAISRQLSGGHNALTGDLGQLFQALTCGPPGGMAPEPTSEKLVIIPTRTCNMRCVYCDFGAANTPRTVLEPQLACRMVDYYAMHMRTRPEGTLHIHFFGGEPLIARECMETVVHYARSLCARTGMIPWFEVTTNGLFEPGAEAFVGDYFDSVVVSLDGTRDCHDYNRRGFAAKGTYTEIAANIRRLSGYQVELCLRMCVTNRSVGRMAEIAEWFFSEFEFDVLSFEMLVENERGRRFGLYAPDPYAFAAGVLKAEAAALKQGVRVVHGPSELVGPRLTSCPLGQGTLMLSPDGRVTACYLDPERWTARGLDLVIGHVDAVTGVSVDGAVQAKVDALLRSKPRCERCFCRFTCAGGCHVDQTPPGCSQDYDSRCRAIRVITAGRILRSLGCEEDADLLAERRSDMQALACNPDDHLVCWKKSP
jgi:uncharacterized protein